jgi:hypothetical protein
LTDQDGMRNVVLMSATRILIGDLLQIPGRFADVTRQLDEAEKRFIADGDHDPQNWFSIISACIDLLRKLIGELIGDDTVLQAAGHQLQLDATESSMEESLTKI